MTQLIRVGHSPDPDDAFMFHALANDKIPTGNYRFVHELQDIETLNRRALKGELEVSALSIHAYAHLLDKYALLPSGCSMGDKYGPMVVARKPMKIEELSTITIAVPGTMTTAFLTLKLLFNAIGMAERFLAMCESVFDAESNEARNIFHRFLAEIFPHDVSAQRQRQARPFLPPDTEIDDEV